MVKVISKSWSWGLNPGLYSWLVSSGLELNSSQHLPRPLCFLTFFTLAVLKGCVSSIGPWPQNAPLPSPHMPLLEAQVEWHVWCLDDEDPHRQVVQGAWSHTGTVGRQVVAVYTGESVGRASYSPRPTDGQIIYIFICI